MKRLIVLAMACLSLISTAAYAQSVVTYHNSPARSGLYTVSGLDVKAAARLHLDQKFTAVAMVGKILSQPLYWHPSGAKIPLLIVTTESNYVYALNANTGAQVWVRRLAPAAPLSVLGCGDVDPEGTSGTPVINSATGTLYLDALMLTKANTPRHMVYAISLATGRVLPSWPLNVEAALNTRKVPFSSYYQGERSALQFFKGKVYVNYGGRSGDCGSYHGTVIEITPSTLKVTGSWQTRAIGGGIWSQGGVASDGTYLYATTGNTFGARTWSDGEAIIRLSPGLARTTSTKGYFSPSNWQTLDGKDLDLGGTEALPITVPSGSKTVARMIALGKDGNAYLVDAANLGGFGHQISTLHVTNWPIVTGPAVYSTETSTLVAFTNLQAATSGCSGNMLIMLRVTTGSSPLSVAWCSAIASQGAPIITTSDGTADPIVWVTGAGGDNKLHGFNALTGQPIYNGTYGMAGLHGYSTIIAANKHIYAAGNYTVYGFTF